MLGIGIVLKHTVEARIKVYETTPRDDNKLQTRMARRKQEIRRRQIVGEPDHIPRAELDALKDLQCMVYKFWESHTLWLLHFGLDGLAYLC
jgi:hypothetical protein